MTNTKTFTSDAIVSESGRGYYLAGFKLKTPISFTPDYIYQKVDFTSIVGKVSRDVSSKKKKYMLTFKNMPSMQVTTLQEIIAMNEAVSFVVDDEGALNISTTVFPYIASITYEMLGNDYRSNLQIELIEEE